MLKILECANVWFWIGDFRCIGRLMILLSNLNVKFFKHFKNYLRNYSNNSIFQVKI